MNKATVRLAISKSDLALMKLKKSGVNSYAKFNYFELGDFLPQVNELFKIYELGSRFYIDEPVVATDANGSPIIIDGEFKILPRMAHLVIYDCNDPSDSIEYSIDFVSAPVKGATPIQELGSQITYLRRYLWMIAMEISENDVQDAVVGKEDNKTAEKPKQAKVAKDYPINESQIKILTEQYADSLPKVLEWAKVERVEQLTLAQASQAIKRLAGDK